MARSIDIRLFPPLVSLAYHKNKPGVTRQPREHISPGSRQKFLWEGANSIGEAKARCTKLSADVRLFEIFASANIRERLRYLGRERIEGKLEKPA